MPAPAATPEHAVLLRDFANTIDVEDGTDELESPARLAAWLRAHGLLDSGMDATDDDVSAAARLRGGLRTALIGHHDGGASGAGQAELEPVASRLPLRLSFSESGPRLQPALDGVPGALAALLVAVNAAVADGSWARLKICPAEDCAWAFYDVSKNRSRTWCDIAG